MTDQLNDEYSKNIYFRNFCDNLDALGLTYAEVKRDYKYSGGTNGPHKNYFDLCFPMNTKPEKKRYCLCDHFIKDNCYLSKDFDIDTILIVGNCCIKKFIDKSSRTCEHCNAPHKNRSLNYCNTCKEYVKRGYTEKCLSCNSLSRSLSKTNKCDTCNKGSCFKCNKNIDPKFKYCYTCNLINKK
jgi:hypothetical protein